MNSAIQLIKTSFLEHYELLGNTVDQVLDELDMAVYQHRELRNTPAHVEILRWGMAILKKGNQGKSVS